MISPAQDPYASRTDRSSAIIARQDPVVYEDGQYANALSGEQVGQYERDGFLLLENLFSEAEIRALSSEVERMTRDPSIIRREESITEPGSNAVRSIFMVHVLNPVLSRLVRDPRLVNVARQILGSEVYIHQSRANMKPGFKGKEFYWHSDFETWHVEDGMPSMRALSCSVLLTANNECNGPLMLARFASAVHFVRWRNPERALQAIAEEAGVWRAGPGQPAIAGGAGRHPLHDGQGRFGGVLRLQHDARLEQQHLAVAARQRVHGLQQHGKHLESAQVRADAAS